MLTGYLIVESKPSSPEAVDEFNHWYDEVHIPELLQVEGIASARRLESVEGGSFVALYELDRDIETVQANMAAARKARIMTPPVGLQLDPPPSVRFFSMISSHPA